MERRSDEAAVHEPVSGPVAPPRPLPDHDVRERLAAWGAWFGLPRLVATAVCMLVVAGGGYWLVRAPAPATEAGLPRSSVAATVVVTLPEPTTPVSAVSEGGDAVGAHADVVVHVAGRVIAPGVYVLGGAPRVHDAIEVAGGPSAGADLDALNLAAVLVDGQRLYVPAIGDVEPGVVVLPDPPTIAGGDTGPPSADRPIDLNRATAAELDTLPGVGPATAQAIVDDRERNGPFARVDDLERVPGIGPAKLATVRDLVTV